MGDSTKARLSELMTRMEDLSTDSCNYRRLKTVIVDFENDLLGSRLSRREKEAISEVHKVKRINPSFIVTTNQPIIRAKLSNKIGKWFAVTACDIGLAIADLSVASGAAASDYMSAILDLH